MSTSDLAILDESVLDQLLASVEGDRAFVDDLVAAYLADSEAHVEAARQAVAAGDADALVRPAHTLKSSSATVGALRLSATARELEMAGRAGSVGPDVAAAVDRMDAEWASTGEVLRAWMASGA